MTEQNLNELFEYAVKLRRRLHEIPEIGFELEKTLDCVKAELEAAGIEYTF